MDYTGNGGVDDDDDNDKSTGKENTSLKKATSAGPGASEIGVAAVAAAGVGLLAWGLSSFFSSPSASSSSEKKMMKAPGKKGETMYRDDFEENPSAYFRDLRKK